MSFNLMRNELKIFKALSDSNRLRIVKMLALRPLCVCEITAVLGLAASTVSKHLSILREADLIADRKEGKWVNYYLTSEATGPTAEILGMVESWLPDDEIIVADSEKVALVDRNQLCGG